MTLKHMLGFLSVLACLVLSQCGQCNHDPKADSVADKPAQPSGPKVTCPVCGLSFPKSEAVGSVMISGKTYYFFLEDHQKAFQADPEAFLGTD